MKKLIEELSKLIGANVGQLPDTPDDIILMNIESGGEPLRSLGKKRSDLTTNLLRITVRNKSYFKALEEIEKLTSKLDGYSSENVLSLTLFNPVSEIGRDTKDRYLFGIDFKIMKEEE